MEIKRIVIVPVEIIDFNCCLIVNIHSKADVTVFFYIFFVCIRLFFDCVIIKRQFLFIYQFFFFLRPFNYFFIDMLKLFNITVNLSDSLIISSSWMQFRKLLVIPSDYLSDNILKRKWICVFAVYIINHSERTVFISFQSKVMVFIS